MDTRNVNQAHENVIARLHAIRRQWWWLTLSEGLLKCLGILALLTVSMLIVFTVSFQVSQSILLFWVRIAATPFSHRYCRLYTDSGAYLTAFAEEL